MTLIVRKARHKLSYKNRRFGLTSLEKMTLKSVGEYIERLSNISMLNETFKLDKLIKKLYNIYMDIIIADDLTPRTRVKKHPFYMFDQVDEETSYIYYTERSSSITSSTWTRCSRRECPTRELYGVRN
jgi:hypothetical protein